MKKVIFVLSFLIMANSVEALSLGQGGPVARVQQIRERVKEIRQRVRERRAARLQKQQQIQQQQQQQQQPQQQ